MDNSDSQISLHDSFCVDFDDPIDFYMSSQDHSIIGSILNSVSLIEKVFCLIVTFYSGFFIFSKKII